MGMSASQVRFLSLQSRKNNISRQLSGLSNRKMALSRDMNKVAKNYTNALNQINLKWSNDCGVNYNPLSYDLMMKPNELNTALPYILTDNKTNRVILNSDILQDKDGNDIKLSSDITGADGTTIAKSGEVLSYVTIAKMISNFSTVNDYSKIEYGTNGVSSSNGVLVGNKAVENAYYIPNAKSDYNFDNTLRYEIFSQLGLVTEDQKAKQVSLLNQLYGSKEAQASGVYPVGSAWGDYYIAVANLEAYEDFLFTDQKLSVSSATNGTKDTKRTYTDSSTSYNYKAVVDGSVGNSTIEQTSSSALTHINFSAITTTTNDGYYATIYSTDSDWTALKESTYETAGNAYDSTTTAQHNDNGSGKAYDDIYEIDVSDNGIKYTYKIDNIVNKYYCETGETVSGVTEGLTSNGTAKTILLANRVNEYYLGANNTRGKIENDIKGYLTTLKGKVKTILTKSGISVNNDALQNAYEMTLQRFSKDSVDNIGPHCASDDKAKSNSEGITTAAITRYKFHLDGIFSWHRARTKTAFDATQLFNVFMTYYEDQCRLLSDGSETNSWSTTVNFEPLSTSTITDSDSHVDIIINGATNEMSFDRSSNILTITDNYTNTDLNMVITVSKQSAERNDTDIDFYYDTRTHSIEGTRTINPCMCYKITGDPQSITYVKDSSDNYVSFGVDTNSDGTVDISNAIATVSVLTTVDGSSVERTYFLQNGTQINDFINNGTIPTTTPPVPHVDTPYYSGGGRVTFSADTDDSLSIETSASDSRMAIAIDAKVKEYEEYHNKLKGAVSDARDRITSIEDELENFYSAADQKLMDYYDALFMRIAEQGWVTDEKTSTVNNVNANEYLNTMLQNNIYFVTTCRDLNTAGKYKYTTQLATNVKKIYQVHDDNAENQALAEYEADKTLIQSKEKQIDARMLKLETEQEAINTEMESIKKVRDDNIQRFFKIFA